MMDFTGTANPNCDGSGPCMEGEVRVLPTGGDSNAILCPRCYRREMAYRRQRNEDLPPDCQFDLPMWHTLKVYDTGESENEGPEDRGDLRDEGRNDDGSGESYGERNA